MSSKSEVRWFFLASAAALDVFIFLFARAQHLRGCIDKSWPGSTEGSRRANHWPKTCHIESRLLPQTLLQRPYRPWSLYTSVCVKTISIPTFVIAFRFTYTNILAEIEDDHDGVTLESLHEIVKEQGVSCSLFVDFEITQTSLQPSV